MAISTNQKPTIYRNLYENTGPDSYWHDINVDHEYMPNNHIFMPVVFYLFYDCDVCYYTSLYIITIVYTYIFYFMWYYFYISRPT